MENSAPSLKIFRTKFSTSALYNGRNKNRRQKTRFENLLKQLFHSPLLDMKWLEPTRSTRSLVILSLHNQLGLME